MESTLTVSAVKGLASDSADRIQAWWANGGKKRSILVTRKAAWYLFVCLMVLVAALYLASKWAFGKVVEHEPQIKAIVIGGLTQYLPQQAKFTWDTGWLWADKIVATSSNYAHEVSILWSESVAFILCSDEAE